MSLAPSATHGLFLPAVPISEAIQSYSQSLTLLNSKPAIAIRTRPDDLATTVLLALALPANTSSWFPYTLPSLTL